MKIEINIEKKHLLYLVVITTMVGGVGLGVAFNSSGSVFNTNSAGPMEMGHSPDEIFCNGCIADDNIKAGANIDGSKIKDGTITAAKLSGGAGGGDFVIVTKGVSTGSERATITATATCPTGKTIKSACTGTGSASYNGDTIRAGSVAMFGCQESTTHSCVGQTSCSVSRTSGNQWHPFAAAYTRILCG